ncbi:unnamed protein product [Scytosiphon promiscuus]
MMQHVRCSYLGRGGNLALRRTAEVKVSRRHLRSSSSANINATTSSAAAQRSSSGRCQDRPGLAGVPGARVGGVTIACLAAAAAAVICTRPTEVMAAESRTPSTAATAAEKEADGEDDEEDNASLVAAAHELRRALTPPQQSLFRVVCILVYEDFSGRLHRITGTNAESSTIGGSICAERAAMCKLREASDCKRVTKVVVVTDNPGPLAPGVLCREFLSAHLAPSTPVVMSGSGNDGSSSAIVGGLLYEEADLKPPSRADVPLESTGRVAGVKNNGGAHSPPWTGAAGMASPAASTCGCVAAVGVDEAPPRVTTPPGVLMSASQGEPVSLMTTVARGGKDREAGGRSSGGSQSRGQEGAPMDVCTVGDLYPCKNMYGVTGRGEQLRLGFLVQQTAEEISKPGASERLGLDSGVLEAYDAAWRATEEDKRDGVHPIRYASVALFPDGEAEVTHQLKALEYGATLDPVTLLAPAMMRRAKDGIRPSWVLLVDQFGNLHAPFAQARTFLLEHGFGETKIAVHGEDGAIVVVKAKDLVPKVTTAR